MHILIWGTGKRAKDYYDNHFFDSINIDGFVDNNPSCKEFYGAPVLRPDEAEGLFRDTDYIVISCRAYKDIVKQCLALGIDWNKIVITENDGEDFCADMFQRLSVVAPELYKKKEYSPYVKVFRNEYDKVDEKLRIGNGRYAGQEYLEYEYFRYRTFELVAKEIVRKKVEGAVAELGVFRGAFSALINDIFNDRNIYMFDTFEGFNPDEASKEIEMGRCDDVFIEGHKNTNVDVAIQALPHPELAVICKGFFPDSVTAEAASEKYAFVSLDVDFEESTYQGLLFFYPRMSENGVIFIHDYNTSYLDGVKTAIRRFEDECEMALKAIPLADRAGTLAIIK